MLVSAEPPRAPRSGRGRAGPDSAGPGVGVGESVLGEALHSRHCDPMSLTCTYCTNPMGSKSRTTTSTEMYLTRDGPTERCVPEVWLWGLLGLRVFPLKPRQPEQLRWCGPARGPSPSTLNRTHHCCSLCANQ